MIGLVYQGACCRYSGTLGAMMGVVTVREHAQAGAIGRAPPSARLVRLAASAGFSWSLASAALALTVATTVVAIMDGDQFFIFLVPGLLAAALMGGLVAARRPGHPMGSLLGTYGLAGSLCAAAFAYARAAVVHVPGRLPFGVPVMWVTSWDYTVPYCLGAVVLPLVFPDGHLLSRRWRAALWSAAAYVVLSMAGNAFAPQSMGGWFGDQSNPYAVHGRLFGLILDLAGVCGFASAVTAVASVAVRWHRSGHLARQQLKWFLATLPFLFASTIVGQFFPDALTLGLVLGSAASLLTAVAIGLGVLRYRLYEIDILLSRAAVYGLLSVAVAAVYLTVVAVAGGLTSVGRGLSVQMLATVMAAALMLPVRGRLQRQVDRLFFGDRGAPYAAMARLGRRVEEATTAEPVLSSVVTVVAGSLRLPYAAVDCRMGDRWIPSAAWGRAPAEVISFPLMFQRETVGRLLVGQRALGERLSQDDERLLANLARQVAPAAHAVALRQALDTSRAELVSAREEERRRLRRDLHDGLGSTVAALTLGLETACAMSAGHRELMDLLSRLRAESQRAVGDIRRIVYGLRPPALDEFGLAGALYQQVDRLERQAAGLSINLHISEQRLDGLSAAVEVAVYQIVTEAVTNVLRHAHACCCEISIRSGQRLKLEVCDDGSGMSEGWQAGVGITAMRERVAELGGELTIEPGRPRGTRIVACLPTGGQHE